MFLKKILNIILYTKTTLYTNSTLSKNYIQTLNGQKYYIQIKVSKIYTNVKPKIRLVLCPAGSRMVRYGGKARPLY